MDFFFTYDNLQANKSYLKYKEDLIVDLLTIHPP